MSQLKDFVNSYQIKIKISKFFLHIRCQDHFYNRVYVKWFFEAVFAQSQKDQPVHQEADMEAMDHSATSRPTVR